jgi:large subunit ribosomal protein L15
MRLHELYPFAEERKKRKRVGRGSGSGRGKTSGKGHKGQNSRSGVSRDPSFEGGQMPIMRRLPKRGFNNVMFKTVYEIINLGRLNEVFGEAQEITLEDIYNRGLARKGRPVKVLGVGEFSRAITVQAHAFSASAAEKIKNAGGEAKALEG